jgi:hypothetical protein
MFDLLALGREDDLISVCDEGGRRFQKKQRISGNLRLHFRGMFRIVTADRDDLRREAGEQKADLGKIPRLFESAKFSKGIALNSADPAFADPAILGF